MRVFGLPKAFYQVLRWKGRSASARAEERVRLVNAWMALRERGASDREACEVLGVSRASLYRWRRRLRQGGPKALEDRSRRPRRVRRPKWTVELLLAVKRLREAYPAWGKAKLAVLLRREGWEVSESTVGRILAYLRRRGEVEEAPVRRAGGRRRRRLKRPWAERLPKGCEVQVPGDLVKVDTLTVTVVPGVVRKQFTARDVVSRWDVMDVFGRATAHTAVEFLDALEARMPFPVRAICVDGGSEFKAEFEAECQRRGIRPYELPPRSPKPNGHVERAQGTHRYEFYEAYDLPWRLEELRPLLRQWEWTYNFVRPHQALGGKTPAEYLRENYPEVALPDYGVSHVLN